MNWRLYWHRLTHHLFHGKNWLLIIGQDIDNRDWGITYKRGEATPVGDWKRFRTEFRINLRWPVSIRIRKSS